MSKAQELLGLLFVANEPMAVGEIADVFEETTEQARARVDGLAALLAAEGTGLTLHERRSGWQLVTAPSIAATVDRYRKVRRPRPLTVHAKETLFAVLLDGPLTRQEIAEYRGPTPGNKKTTAATKKRLIDPIPSIRTLLRRGLIREAGRRATPGRPILYTPTPRAREMFPDIESLAAEILGRAPGRPAPRKT